MMPFRLVALAALGVTAIPIDHANAQTQVQRLRDACITTDMNRESFQRLFASSGFEPLIPVARQGAPARSDWMSGYETRGVQIVMEGRPGSSDATDCGVLDPRPTGDWRGDLNRLAQDLAMSPVTGERIPDAAESGSWSASGERPLTLHYEVYGEALVVRFARAFAHSH